MSHLRALPELVQDSQLDVTIQGHTTIHRAPLECRDSMSPQYWETVEPLGQGGDGMVFLQQKIRGPGNVENLAVKQMMLKADLTSEDHDSKRYLRELEALAKFAQGRYARFFVKSYGWYQHQRMLYICMEYCKHSDLGNYLKTHTTLSEEYVRTIALQVSQGLRRMHDNNIAHRDLKPANILIHRQPPEDDEWWVVLGDLGLSRRSGDSSGTTTIRGTPRFMAPETMGKPFGGNPKDANLFSADMWCLGETISCALTGQGTFSDDGHLLRYQSTDLGFPDETLKRCGASALAIDFIHSLMHKEPLQRLTATQALDHPWFEVNHISTMPKPMNSTTNMVYHSGSWVSKNESKAIPIKDVNGNVLNFPEDKLSRLHWDMQPSMQWKQPVPTYLYDTQASAEWTRTITNPVLQKNTQSSLDQSALDLGTLETAIAAHGVKKVPGLEQVPNWPLINKAVLHRSERDYGGAAKPRSREDDLLESFKQFSDAERLRIMQKHENYEHDTMVARFDDLKSFSQDFKLSTPVPPSLLPLLSKDEEKQRRIEASAKQDALIYRLENGETYDKTMGARAFSRAFTATNIPQRQIYGDGVVPSGSAQFRKPSLPQPHVRMSGRNPSNNARRRQKVMPRSKAEATPLISPETPGTQEIGKTKKGKKKGRGGKEDRELSMQISTRDYSTYEDV